VWPRELRVPPQRCRATSLSCQRKLSQSPAAACKALCTKHLWKKTGAKITPVFLSQQAEAQLVYQGLIES